MKSKVARITAVLVLASAGIGCAHAQYRCDPPPTRIDRNACQAAADSPQALRQYVQRMRWITNIQFSDYVNQRTIDGWEAMKREQSSEGAAGKQGRSSFTTSNSAIANASPPGN